MLRALLIAAVCLTLALYGVAGIHVHVPGGAHETEGHAHAIAALDHDHDADHDERGQMDLQPVVKAFGKIGIDFIVPALALLLVLLVAMVGGHPWSRPLTRARPRPPRRKFLLLFLGAAQAPPIAA